MYRYEVTESVKDDIEGVVGRPLFYDDGGDYFIDAPKHTIAIQYNDSATGDVVSNTLDQICDDLYSSDFAANSTEHEVSGEVIKVQPQPSTEDVSLRLEGVHFTAAPNSTTTHFEKVGGVLNKDYYLRGGELQAVNASSGDTFEVHITDKDNILGYGANFRVSDYIPKMYLFKHTSGANAPIIDIVDDDVSALISQHLYFELVCNNNQPVSGGNTIDIVINFWKYIKV